MTVGRPHATTREDIQRLGCFKCGGPHFYRNKRTGAVCTANKKPEDLKDKPVLPKPVDLVAKPLINMHSAAPRSFASVVSSSIDSKLVDNLKLEVQRLSGLVEELNKQQERITRFLQVQHLHHFVNAKCSCNLQLNKAKPAQESAIPSSSAAQRSSHSPVPMDSDASNGPETKLDSTSALSASQSLPSSSIVCQPVHLSAAPAASALDSKRATKTNSDASTSSAPKDSISSSSPAIPSSLPPSVQFKAPVLSPEEAKAAFTGTLKRDRETQEQGTAPSDRAKKRQRQVLTAKRRHQADDWFLAAPVVGGVPLW